MSWLASLAGPALQGIGSIASMLLGKNLIFDKNANVAQKLLSAVTWTPIYVFKEGGVKALHTMLEITGAPPLTQGSTYNWDRLSEDVTGPGPGPRQYGVIAGDTTLGGTPANDRMPTHGVACLVLKQGDSALDFTGDLRNTPKLQSLPMNVGSQFTYDNNIAMTRQNAWGDPAELIDAVRFYVTGYDHHVPFQGGFADASSFPADKMAKLGDGDMLVLVTIATDASPLLNVWPNPWMASDPSLCYGMITGNVSLVWEQGH